MKLPFLLFFGGGTVDGSEIRKKPVEGKVVYPVIYRVWDTSKVFFSPDFWTTNSITLGAYYMNEIATAQ